MIARGYVYRYFPETHPLAELFTYPLWGDKLLVNLNNLTRLIWSV